MIPQTFIRMVQCHPLSSPLAAATCNSPRCLWKSHRIYSINWIPLYELPQATKPKLQSEIAPPSPVPIGYVYEEDIDDFLQVFIEIKAFPTYVYFKEGKEVARAQGADLNALQEMIKDQQ
jgi:hypothetical protein